MIFGDDHVTTGAADDLKRATELATSLVKQFGMSDKLGLRDFFAGEHNNSIVTVNELSPQTSELIDQEIARLLRESYERAKKILTEKSREHHLLAETLLEFETLSADEIRTLFQTGKLERPNLTQEPIVELIPRPGEKKRTRNKHANIIHVNVD
jgi:ATP-dependent Zn protease